MTTFLPLDTVWMQHPQLLCPACLQCRWMEPRPMGTWRSYWIIQEGSYIPKPLALWDITSHLYKPSWNGFRILAAASIVINSIINQDAMRHFSCKNNSTSELLFPQNIITRRSFKEGKFKTILPTHLSGSCPCLPSPQPILTPQEQFSEMLK